VVTAIIGYGVVGRNMRILFRDARIVDPDHDDSDKPGLIHYDIAFVCVPTDPLSDGSCDTSIVEAAIKENKADIFVIKSTVPPGTTEKIMEETGKNCVFSPEFFGGTQHANAVDYSFVILGGYRPHTDKVAELYKTIKDGSFHIAKTEPCMAELVKYAENCFLATKVTFFHEFSLIAESMGLDSDEFRELLLMDPRIGRSHSFTYRQHPWYQSHCLDKDIPAFIQFALSTGQRARLIEAVDKVNKEHQNGNA